MGKGDKQKSNKEVKKPKKDKAKSPFSGEAGSLRATMTSSAKKPK